MKARVGIDIGGTFTDIVLTSPSGSVLRRKVLSTPHDYTEAIVRGVDKLLAEAGLQGPDVSEIVHGTTVATNAIIENKGAKTALITTEGFRDVLEIARVRIPRLYDLNYRKPPPLVPRRMRFEVTERVGSEGEIISELDDRSVQDALISLAAAEAESVAVCLVNSFRNAGHEHAIAAAIAEVAPNLYVTCSADILPEIREYERTSTAVINSYVGPIVSGYLRRLRERFAEAGVDAPLLVMQSNGGAMTAEVASERPAQIVESGPAAGVIAAHAVSVQAGYQNVITLDMGGTTAKASLIESAAIALTSDYEVGAGINTSSLLVAGGGYALKLPAIDISEVGAGGGSLVAVGDSGRLLVGPKSAGASPGPVCYGLGGTRPTVTDANLVLGFLNASALAGGSVALDHAAAYEAIDGAVARPLGISVLDAAYGVHVLASAQMVRSVKAVSTYRGRDPREFVLLGFGGSGPLHVCEMARQLEIDRIIVPPAAGLLSAFGLLLATIEHQSVRTILRTVDAGVVADLNAALWELEGRALKTLQREGYSPDDVLFSRSVDMRYQGQGFELTVPLHAKGDVTTQDIEALTETFGDEHELVYGHRDAQKPVEIVNLRSNARVASPRADSSASILRDVAPDEAEQHLQIARDAYFGPEHGTLRVESISRGALAAGPRVGPFMIDEYDTTCVVYPGFQARLDEFLNIIIQRERSLQSEER